MNTVRLRNITGVPQNVLYKGDQFILAAFEEEDFPEEVAKKWLIQSPDQVTVVKQDQTIQEQVSEDEQWAWVANVSGCKEVMPKQIRKVVLNRNTGQREELVVPNPALEPRTYTRMYSPGEVNGHYDKYNYWKVTYMPPYEIAIQPGKRVKLRRQIAAWFMGRQSKTEHRDGLVWAKAPTAFEPNLKWNLDDLRIYLKLQDPTAELPTTQDAWERNQKPRKTETEADFAKRKANDMKAIKRALFSSIFYRLSKKDYPTVTEEMFQELKTGKSAEDFNAEFIEEIVATQEAALAEAK